MHNKELVKKLEAHEALSKTKDIISKYIPVKKIKNTDIINAIIKNKKKLKIEAKAKALFDKAIKVSDKFIMDQIKTINANRKRREEKYE